jgi:hypothetical protein
MCYLSYKPHVFNSLLHNIQISENRHDTYRNDFKMNSIYNMRQLLIQVVRNIYMCVCNYLTNPVSKEVKFIDWNTEVKYQAQGHVNYSVTVIEL